MTRIGPIEVGGVRLLADSNYGVTIASWVLTEDEFKQIKELFALSSTSTAIEVTPGDVPRGYDHTEDSVNIQFCEFTTQAIMKLRDGWYLLRGLDYDIPARRPTFLFTISLFYLGPWESFKTGFRVTGLERDAGNDWGI